MKLETVLEILFQRARGCAYREYLWRKLRPSRGFAGNSWGSSLHVPAEVHCHPSPSEGGSIPLSAPVTGIREKLFDQSPYDKFDPHAHPDDVQGWGSDDPALIEAIRVLQPTRICEVGSWKGRSAINMGRAVKNLGLDTEIVCVDTWLGSPEHWVTHEPEWYRSLRILNGFPQLYYTFLANVVRAGLSEIITPFPATSENAAQVFKKLGIQFDLVYIDAAHEYAAAKRDISMYYELVAEDGLLIGDDYIYWPGVTQAADEFVLEHGVPSIGKPGKVIIPKGKKYANINLHDFL